MSFVTEWIKGRMTPADEVEQAAEAHLRTTARQAKRLCVRPPSPTTATLSCSAPHRRRHATHVST